MDLFTNVEVWQIFVVVGLILSISEVFIPGFVMLPAGLGFLLASLFVSLTDSTAYQLFILACCEALVLAYFFKVIRPKFTSKDNYKSNADSMIGKTASVIQEIRGNNAGYVKLYGDEWRAISSDGSDYAVGESVEIQGIDGNKVIVKTISE